MVIIVGIYSHISISEVLLLITLVQYLFGKYRFRLWYELDFSEQNRGFAQQEILFSRAFKEENM